MASEIVIIDPSKLQPYEAAAKFLSVVAYPLDFKSRENFKNALCYKAIRERAKSNKQFAQSRIEVHPSYFLPDPADIDMIFKTGNKQLERRLLAGQFVCKEVYEGLTGKEAKRIGDFVSTVDNRLRFIHSNILGKEGNDVKHLTTQIITPSKPVIHICFVLFNSIVQNVIEIKDAGHLIYLISQSANILRTLVDASEKYRPEIKSLGQVSINEHDTIQVLMA